MPLRPPDIDGTAGHAYLLPRERQVAWAQAHPDHHGLAALQAQVEAWFVNGDSFHPFWQWWSADKVAMRAMRAREVTP